VAIRVARPERLFTKISTDDVTTVLAAIRLPAAENYPSSWLAQLTTQLAGGESITEPALRLLLLAVLAFATFFLVASRFYLRAFVRSREGSAPGAIGGDWFNGLVDRRLRTANAHTRAVVGKEIRILTRDAAQWSQLFMMVALLFLYLYNIQTMPLEGDIRAGLLAYLNLGMSGFVCAAIALRFGYPSLSAEGKQYWLLRSSPLSLRRLLWLKSAVVAVPLTLLALFLTVVANLMLSASLEIWLYTLPGAFMVTTTVVLLAVGMGALNPDFKLENPLEAAVSLGGFAYMATSLLYICMMMMLLARPFQRFASRVIFGASNLDPFASAVVPVVIAVTVSLLLAVLPLELAGRRLEQRDL